MIVGTAGVVSISVNDTAHWQTFNLVAQFLDGVGVRVNLVAEFTLAAASGEE